VIDVCLLYFSAFSVALAAFLASALAAFSAAFYSSVFFDFPPI
jgi:hypothetical protein